MSGSHTGAPPTSRAFPHTRVQLHPEVTLWGEGTRESLGVTQPEQVLPLWKEGNRSGENGQSDEEKVERNRGPRGAGCSHPAASRTGRTCRRTAAGQSPGRLSEQQLTPQPAPLRDLRRDTRHQALTRDSHPVSRKGEGKLIGFGS